jgi:small subunit ribosomal protein S16
MATKIRLKRIGRRNRPFYRIIVIDSRKRRDGSEIELLGWYNPMEKNKDQNYKINENRLIDWLKEGAQPTDPINKIMKRSGLSYKWHLIQQGLDEDMIAKALDEWKKEREAVIENRKKKSIEKKENKKAENVANVEAPAEEVTEEAPAEEVTEEAPAEEVTEEAPAEEVTEEAPAEEVTEDSKE